MAVLHTFAGILTRTASTRHNANLYFFIEVTQERVRVRMIDKSTLPFAVRAIRKDPMVGLLSPVLLAARACAQVLGVAGGRTDGQLQADS